MELRFIAVILIVLCGAFCGALNAEKLKHRVQLCCEAEKLMRLSETMIRTGGSDIYSIVKKLKAEKAKYIAFISKLPDSFSADCSIREKWRELLLRDTSVPEEESAVLLEFGSVLGTTDVQGQLSSIDALLVRIEELREQRRQEYLQKGRLYRSLGVMAGVSVGIILI
ncbi:stage III sporulation protein AB [Ruminococcus sp.]|uniref:stage III sporulation protein AB n=1 Tax=Ruminococcus sp. TaxID=41978 RepID=UPI0025CEDE35|nr:stage III sporulation protein AB [Ruminococcus sp.]MBQ6250545.1 stage III sporulation protein AB [Ruminococcus sp.]MBR6996460.1 stage III sporulation protein AB [Ruminococcus sp.]